jgi:hypothetical protein
LAEFRHQAVDLRAVIERTVFIEHDRGNMLVADPKKANL